MSTISTDPTTINDTPDEVLATGELETIIDGQPNTRVVNLIYKDCCGCGCDETAIQRTVPMDSVLNNGDTVHELLPGDKQV